MRETGIFLFRKDLYSTFWKLNISFFSRILNISWLTAVWIYGQLSMASQQFSSLQGSGHCRFCIIGRFSYTCTYNVLYIYILYSLPNSYLPYGDIPDVDRQTAGNANVTTRLYKSMVSSPFRANVQKCRLQVHIIGRVLLSFDRQSMAVIIEKRDMAHTCYMFFLHPFSFKYRLFAG